MARSGLHCVRDLSSICFTTIKQILEFLSECGSSDTVPVI